MADTMTELLDELAAAKEALRDDPTPENKARKNDAADKLAAAREEIRQARAAAKQQALTGVAADQPEEG
jgi:hypothetical protein